MITITREYLEPLLRGEKIGIQDNNGNLVNVQFDHLAIQQILKDPAPENQTDEFEGNGPLISKHS